METKSDYFNLQTELFKMYSRKKKIVIFLVISSVIGIAAIVFGILNNLAIISENKLEIINTVVAGLFIAFSVFLVLTLSNIALVNMNQSDYEEKMVQGGVEYLSRNQISPKRIEIIARRAEIGNNALSSRTILPVLAIPFLITFFSGELSPGNQLLIAAVIIVIGMSFIVELDRANMDVLIRQICVSYIPPKTRKKKKKD